MPERDDLLAGEAHPEEGEAVLAEFRPDVGTYIRAHVSLAVLGGAAAGIALLALGNPHPWVGPVAAGLAMTVRGLYVRSEAMAARWRLTPRRLLGPGGRAIPLDRIEAARKLMGDIQIVTRDGDKHLMRYMADPATVIARIETARGGRIAP